MSYHNELTHFCREMCNYVNTRFLRPYGVIMEITTKSPQKLYNRSLFSTHFTQKSSFYPLKIFWPQVLKTRFHLWKHCLYSSFSDPAYKSFNRARQSFQMWDLIESPIKCKDTYEKQRKHAKKAAKDNPQSPSQIISNPAAAKKIIFQWMHSG